MSITLKREQIEKLIDIYNHFSDIQTFTISLEEDSDMVAINFNLNDVKSDYTSIYKFDKACNPTVCKCK